MSRAAWATYASSVLLESHELRRPLAIASAIAWLVVGAPVLFQHAIIAPARLALWSAVWLVCLASGVAAFATSKRGARWALLATASVAIVAMALLLCDGFEGALLVLVALSLGGAMPRRFGVAWIVAQSALLATAISIHWSPRPALLIVPPYFGFQLLAFFLADLLAREAAARRDLADANAALSRTQRRVVEHGRLEERMRIARELHDAVGHRLTALALHLELATRLAEGRTVEPIATACTLSRAALDDLRAAVEHLRDDERIDLAAAIHLLISEIPTPRVHLDVPEGLCRDEPERAITVLRCTQEILTNAVRHASATNVWIAIAERGGTIELSARDDGHGVAVVASGNGLRGMRERVEESGGAIEIASSVGSGFAVRALLPRRA